MLKRYCLLFLFFCLSASAQQNIEITGTFRNNSQVTSASLVTHYPQERAIAGVPVQNGAMRMAIPGDTPVGIYRLYYSAPPEGLYIDIIINGEKEIAFTLDAAAPTLPSFEKSPENRMWYAYRAEHTMTQAKITPMTQFVQYYPEKKDKIYQEVRKSLLEEQKHLQQQYDKFVTANSGNLAGMMVKNRPPFFPNADATAVSQQESAYSNFWNGVDANPKLLNTPFYSDLIFEYINFYIRLAQVKGNGDQETGFMKASDEIMSHLGANPDTRQFALDFLTRGFKEMGYDTVLQYLDETYRVEQCENSNDADFNKRMASYNALRPGTPAPEIRLGGLGLRDIPGDRLVIAFWAGWCPHCREEMPRLDAAVKDKKNITVAAVSLDTEPSLYNEASGSLKNMLHFCDFKKWDGEAAEKFYVSGTPTFFLLDKERKIIGKYTSVGSLLKAL